MTVLDNNGKPINIVLFDLGSTLIYFDALWPELMRQSSQELAASLANLGYTINTDQFVNQFIEKLNDYYVERETDLIEYTTAYLLRNLLAEHGYLDMPENHIRHVLQKMYAVSQAHWHCEDDTLTTLATLKSQGYHLGLISNAADDNDVQDLVDQHNLRQFFELILVSAAVGVRKPHPHIFQLALDHWQALPEQAVMVGDTLEADILGANLTEIFSVWISRRARKITRQDLEINLRPDAVISTLAELPGLLAQVTDN